MSDTSRSEVISFWEYVAFLVNSLIFLLIGIHLAHHHFAAVLLPALAAIVLILTGRALALPLGFQRGVDNLSTAIVPSWQQIGRLGVIAGIRTGLNYFLSKEMEEERATSMSEKTVQADAKGEEGTVQLAIVG